MSGCSTVFLKKRKTTLPTVVTLSMDRSISTFKNWKYESYKNKCYIRIKGVIVEGNFKIIYQSKINPKQFPHWLTAGVAPSGNSECDMSPQTSHTFYFGLIATLIEYLVINGHVLGLIMLCACVYTYIVRVLDNKLFFRIVGAKQLNLGFAVFHAACLLVQIPVRKPYTHTHTHTLDLVQPMNWFIIRFISMAWLLVLSD